MFGHAREPPVVVHPHLNVVVWPCTSPKTWTTFPAACLPKDRYMLKAVAKVYSASLRVTALDKIHRAIRCSLLLC